MKIVIATPFYDHKGHSPYIDSLLQSTKFLSAAGIEWEFMSLSGDTFIDRARNTLAARFLEGDGTHLLFIDSDMSWDVVGFAHLIGADVDLVGGVYPMKNKWNDYVARLHCTADGRPIQRNGLLSAEWAATGFLKISRKVFETMAPSLKDRQYKDAGADPRSPDRIYTPYFEFTSGGGVRCGEDITFSHRWTALGGEVWIEPRVSFDHWGQTPFRGNYHEFLLKQPQPGEASRVPVSILELAA